MTKPMRAAILLILFLAAGAGRAGAQDTPAGILPLDDFSPVFLGMYRKLMVIEDDIRRYSAQYDVDFDLARAVCLYESGGNAGLTSGAGARGYFQVMPPTYRELRVSSNLEAGVKYLAQLIRQFEREDRAVAAYNGGPGRVSRGGGLPLETLQYVLGVGHYRAVLKQHDASLRYHASRLRLVAVEAGDDWASLSAAVGLPEWEMRWHNAFLSERRLRPGQLVAYPERSRGNMVRQVGNAAEYRTRHGDNYLKLAFTLGVEPDAVRAANDIWHLQSVPAGVPLRIPLAEDRSGILRAALDLPAGTRPVEPQIAAAEARTEPEPDRVELAISRPEPAPARAVRARQTIHRVSRGETLAAIARQYETTISDLQRANGMGRLTTIFVGQRLQVPGSGERQDVEHRVTRGETLTGIAERYDTTVSAIQRANRMGRRSTIRLGERLQIPAAGSALVEE
jgi:LysM repeat protein